MTSQQYQTTTIQSITDRQNQVLALLYISCSRSHLTQIYHNKEEKTIKFMGVSLV